MRRIRDISTALFILMILAGGVAPAAAAPEGQMTWGVQSRSPLPGSILRRPRDRNAVHGDVRAARRDGEAAARQPLTPSLAESWTLSSDGLAYEFILRKGTRFHNGDPVTAEDVKYSFERYRGAANKTFKERVAAIEIPGPARVRVRLKEPWPDFLTFYSSATGAGGSCRRNTSKRSGTKDSRSTRSARARTDSSRSRPVSSSCWRPSISTGGNLRR